MAEKKKIVRSKEAFYNAFIELLKETDLKSITVTAISDKAGYSRAAFYQQFESINIFVKTLIDDEIEAYIGVSKSFYEENNRHVECCFPIQSILRLFEYVYSKRDVYRFIFTNYNHFNTVEYFFNKTYEKLPEFRTNFSDNLPDVDPALFTFISSYVQKACIRYWVEHDFKWSAQYMAEQCSLFYLKDRKSNHLVV